MPSTANEEYQDAVIRNQIAIRGYSADLVGRVDRLLMKADRELAEMIRARLPRDKREFFDFKTEKWRLLLNDIQKARRELLVQYRAIVRSDLVRLGVLEAQTETDILEKAIPIEYALGSPSIEVLTSISRSRPFRGKLLKDWFKGITQSDMARIRQQLQIGMSQGESINSIVRRLIGTRAGNYQNGVMATTRREAKAIVRTSVIHVSQNARNEVWDANADIIDARIWGSTLDGRTTHGCISRDGKGAPIGGKPLPEGVTALVPINIRPPAHINCRSVMFGYIDGVGLIGSRPTVTDTRTPAARLVDFRRIARDQGKTIAQVRNEWATKNVGSVPASTNYADFLKRQPASFQDDVLGVTKAKLYRNGGLSVDAFVDRRGMEISLDQLAANRPEAFIRAGLDPDNY